MRIRILVGTMVLFAFVGTLSLSVASRAQSMGASVGSSSAAGETFKVDTVHSSCVYKIRHMGVANFYGRFNDIKGAYSLNGTSSSFNIEVAAKSVDSGNAKRDDHLRSSDFFAANDFPAITFKSTKIEEAGPNKLAVQGDLTLRGVTKPITAAVEYTPGKQTRQGHKSGFEARFAIKRSEFNMNTSIADGGLSDEVEMIVAVEGVKQ